MVGILSKEETDRLLSRNIWGRLGSSYNGKAYVVPIHYVWDGSDLICHTQEGMKVQHLRNNPEACFEVDEIKDGKNWVSVILWGKFEELTDESKKFRALKTYVDKLQHYVTSRTVNLKPTHPTEGIHLNEQRKNVAFVVHVNEISARFEAEEKSFLWDLLGMEELRVEG